MQGNNLAARIGFTTDTIKCNGINFTGIHIIDKTLHHLALANIRVEQNALAQFVMLIYIDRQFTSKFEFTHDGVRCRLLGFHFILICQNHRFGIIGFFSKKSRA